MALDESAVSESLVRCARDGGIDLVRELAQWITNELIEAEATEVIGAGPYERSVSVCRRSQSPSPRGETRRK